MTIAARRGERLNWNFASGETDSTETHDVDGYAGLVLYVPAEFNGDTLTFKSGHANDTGFTVGVVTGRNDLSADDARKFFPMKTLQLVTDNAVSADAVITADVKS